MLGDTGARSASFEQTCRRLRVGAFAVVLAAALSAAGLASASAASAATVFKHSAKSGEWGSGRLTLHGVSKRVAYAIDGGRSGNISVRRLHRRIFLPRLAATGALHVAGQRGGRDPRFKLSKPRYNAARHSVSYRAKPLAKRRAARAAGITPLRNFGAASLSIVPHPRLASGSNGGNDCEARISNSYNIYGALDLVSSSNWPTDTWGEGPPAEIGQEPGNIGVGDYATVESDGGLARGCHWEAVWRPNYKVTISMYVTWPWGQMPSTGCSSSDQGEFPCTQYDAGSGMIGWGIGH
jgi:hypothetical protein